eukprot:g12990.t1
MLVILDMGSLFVQQENTVVTTVICMAFFSIMLFEGSIWVSTRRKQFRFFLCHQKVAAGSLARLLKMELQKRGSRFTTFVDCDDLNDLTRLFSYVGQDTETLVVLASPDILTRKWCVGEICTARIQRVETVVVAFPEYANPDKTFIESYSSIVPDITELANYNLGLVEVEETLRWISTLQTIALPALLTADAVDSLVTDLSGTFKAKSTKLGEVGEDLELRSKQVVWRLQSGDLKPLSSKLATEVSEPSPEPSVEQPLKPLGQAEQVPKVDERSDLVETANAPPMPDKIEPWESEENFSCATIISQEL